MAEVRQLTRAVFVDGAWYGPGPVPDDIAGQITNPKAWTAETAPEPVEPGTPSGARLATTVHVDGKAYGPGDAIPDDIATQITNPKAWAVPPAPATEPVAARPAAGRAGRGKTAAPAEGATSGGTAA